MKLSILLPVFNEEDYIEKTIISLASQNADFICYVSDNDSSDSSLAIIKDNTKNDSLRWTAMKVNDGLNL